MRVRQREIKVREKEKTRERFGCKDTDLALYRW